MMQTDDLATSPDLVEPENTGVVEDASENEAEATPDAPGAARITVVRQGRETDLTFDFVAPATLGRFDPATGPIDVDLGALEPEGAYVSRKHARIDYQDGGFMLVDLGSSNGCFIRRDDFERIEAVELVDGDEFALGNARFKFNVVG